MMKNVDVFFLGYTVIAQNYRPPYGYVQTKLLFVKDSAHSLRCSFCVSIFKWIFMFHLLN